MRVGILEDDTALAQQLESILSNDGKRCFVFQSGQRLIRFLTHETADLLVLDWNVPDMSGFDVVRWVREEHGGTLPIIMMTARTAEEDIVAALKAGADEYVVKPVQPAVLLARIEALCRRAYPEPPRARVQTYGDFTFDMIAESVASGDESIQLTAKEFALALLLFRNRNRTLSRSYIFDAIWGGGANLQTRTLDAHISKIRNKLRLRAPNGFRLVPVYAYGYRLEDIGEDMR